MKKIFLIFLFLISQNVFGGWIEVVRTTEGDVIHVDIKTIKTDIFSKVRVWIMVNNKIGTQHFKSSTYYDEIDCSEKSSISLNAIYYSEPNLQGKIVGSDNDPSKKIYIPPNSGYNHVIKYVCK